jgi:integrase
MEVIMEVRQTKKGARYREMVYVNGRPVKSPFFKKKTSAKEWKAKQVVQREKQQVFGYSPQHYKKLTFEQFGKRWLEEVVALKNTDRTYTNYKSVLLRHLIPTLGNLYLKDIKKTDVDKIVLMLKPNHNPKGINIIIGVLKSIMSEAHRQELILNNPLNRYSKVPEGVRDCKFWSKEEMEQFISRSTDDPLYHLYFMALYTGLRLGELCGLCWDKIDFENNTLTVARTRDRFGARETTKSGLIRHVPMHPKVRVLLQMLRLQKSKSEYVLLEKNGTEIKTRHVYRRFKKSQVNAGIKNLIRFHDLRHTFASRFVMNGGGIFELKALLGHTDIKMTMKYAHHSPDHLQKATQYFGQGKNSEKVNPFLTLKKCNMNDYE